jgi:hypothetical protein
MKKLTGIKVYNFLKKSGFKVINSGQFQRDRDEDFGTWVSTNRRDNEASNGVIYVRPTAGESWEERRELYRQSGGPDKGHQQDLDLSFEMAVKLAEAGYNVYSKLDSFMTIDGRRIVRRCEDLYVTL